MHPDLLRTFLAVAAHGSLTRAAAAVFLSQPAVSRQVQALERELGGRLLERGPGRLRLTDAGRTLAAEAERLLGAHARAAEAVRAHAAPDRGTLRIGASTTPGLTVLPRWLARFHRRHPGVTVGLTLANSREVAAAVVRNDLDVGFTGVDPSAPELVATRVAEDAIVCVAAPSHPLARARRPGATALAAATWILRERGSATRDLAEAWLGRLGVRPAAVIELPSPEAVRAIAATGLGVAAVSRATAAAELAARRLAEVRVPGPRWRRPLYRLLHREKRPGPPLAAFLALAR